MYFFFHVRGRIGTSNSIFKGENYPKMWQHGGR